MSLPIIAKYIFFILANFINSNDLYRFLLTATLTNLYIGTCLQKVNAELFQGWTFIGLTSAPRVMSKQ